MENIRGHAPIVATCAFAAFFLTGCFYTILSSVTGQVINKENNSAMTGKNRCTETIKSDLFKYETNTAVLNKISETHWGRGGIFPMIGNGYDYAPDPSCVALRSTYDAIKKVDALLVKGYYPNAGARDEIAGTQCTTISKEHAFPEGTAPEAKSDLQSDILELCMYRLNDFIMARGLHAEFHNTNDDNNTGDSLEMAFTDDSLENDFAVCDPQDTGNYATQRRTQLNPDGKLCKMMDDLEQKITELMTVHAIELEFDRKSADGACKSLAGEHAFAHDALYGGNSLIMGGLVSGDTATRTKARQEEVLAMCKVQFDAILNSYTCVPGSQQSNVETAYKNAEQGTWYQKDGYRYMFRASASGVSHYKEYDDCTKYSHFFPTTNINATPAPVFQVITNGDNQPETVPTPVSVPNNNEFGNSNGLACTNAPYCTTRER